jgi:hypothetical protein
MVLARMTPFYRKSSLGLVEHTTEVGTGPKTNVEVGVVRDGGVDEEVPRVTSDDAVRLTTREVLTDGVSAVALAVGPKATGFAGHGRSVVLAGITNGVAFLDALTPCGEEDVKADGTEDEERNGDQTDDAETEMLDETPNEGDDVRKVNPRLGESVTGGFGNARNVEGDVLD